MERTINDRETRTKAAENSPPAERPPERSPSDSSLSSYRSSPNHRDEDSNHHNLHPSPPPRLIYDPPHELATAVNRSVQNAPVPVKKAYPVATGDGFFRGAVEESGSGGVKTSATRRTRPPASYPSTSRRTLSEGAVMKAALGFRVFGFVLCLISFSVMAADRNKGWALDSFNRYIEFRYCMTGNVIGFVYSALQGLNLTYQLSSGKLVSGSRLRYIFDFAFDQMLAYLLMSSSSAAAVRVDDWQSNWGKDKFPDMASASVAVSFTSFVAFACSSLISGYTLCTLSSM